MLFRSDANYDAVECCSDQHDYGSFSIFAVAAMQGQFRGRFKIGNDVVVMDSFNCGRRFESMVYLACRHKCWIDNKYLVNKNNVQCHLAGCFGWQSGNYCLAHHQVSTNSLSIQHSARRYFDYRGKVALAFSGVVLSTGFSILGKIYSSVLTSVNGWCHYSTWKSVLDNGENRLARWSIGTLWFLVLTMIFVFLASQIIL